MDYLRLFINNEWQDAADNKRMDVFCPATGEKICEIAAAQEQDVDRAVAAAKAAFESGVWSGLNGDERAEYMLRAADIMKRRTDEFARLEAMDSGKPIKETIEVDIPYAIRAMEYFANIAREVQGSVIPLPGIDGFDYLTYEPFGVVGGITPWNFPLHLATRAMCPAMAAGNTVVIKASSLAPITTSLMGEVFLEAGFPPGVVNIISGSGRVAGEAIASHKDVSMISFTGSESVGRRILELSSKSPIIKKTILELGGKGPFIAEADCELSSAVNSVITGFCLNQGEVCCASTRLYLNEKIYDEFLELLKDRLDRIVYGDILDPKTQMGALIDEHQYEVVDSYVKNAVEEGARLVCGGERYTKPPCEKGFFYKPTVLDNVKNDAKCVQEEIFGPVLVVLKYKDIDEAVNMANESPLGLGAAVWSENTRTLFKTAKKLDSGTVWMNTNIMSKMEAPYGGNKNSGLGREYGAHGLREYMKIKNCILYLGEEYENFYGFED